MRGWVTPLLAAASATCRPALRGCAGGLAPARLIPHFVPLSDACTATDLSAHVSLTVPLRPSGRRHAPCRLRCSALPDAGLQPDFFPVPPTALRRTHPHCARGLWQPEPATPSATYMYTRPLITCPALYPCSQIAFPNSFLPSEPAFHAPNFGAALLRFPEAHPAPCKGYTRGGPVLTEVSVGSLGIHMLLCAELCWTGCITA